MENNYTLIKVVNRIHVVKRAENRRKYAKSHENVFLLPDANYLGLGYALCGVLKPNQTLNDWMLEKQIRIKTRNKQ